MTDYNINNLVIPSMVIKNAVNAIEFYKQVFNAKELYRLNINNKIMHAELLIGNTKIMLSDDMMDILNKPIPNQCQPQIALYIYVDDVDSVFNKAVSMGATIHYSLENHFYGDRMGSILDPFGIMWNIATHIEDVSMEELKNRIPNVIKKMKQTGSGDYYHAKYIKYRQKYMNLKKQN